MTTYTPQDKQGEVAGSAIREGLVNGAVTLVPSGLGLWAAMRYSKFVKATNWQTRTALVAMPALFVFAYTAERKLEHKMKQMANEGSEAWTKQQEAQQQQKLDASIQRISRTLDNDTEKQLLDLYQREVETSGVRIVPDLRLHHKVANFWQENPFKILAVMGVPTVLFIFKGKSHQQHLQLQSKIMHTRVYGQFAIIGMLLSLMGFKEYMDQNGKFITEQEAQAKVEDMVKSREELLRKVELSKKIADDRKDMIKKAHDLDVENNLKKKVAEKKSFTVKSTLNADHSHAH